MDGGGGLNLHLLHLVVHLRETAGRGLRIVELRSPIRRWGNERLVQLRRHWLHGAHPLLLLLLLLLLIMLLLLLLELVVLELRASECSGRPWLEGGSKEKLGWEQRGELHVEPRSRSLHVILTLLHGLCVYGRNVCSSRMSISISTHRELILSIGTVGEAGIAV